MMFKVMVTEREQIVYEVEAESAEEAEEIVQSADSKAELSELPHEVVFTEWSTEIVD